MDDVLDFGEVAPSNVVDTEASEDVVIGVSDSDGVLFPDCIEGVLDSDVVERCVLGIDGVLVPDGVKDMDGVLAPDVVDDWAMGTDGVLVSDEVDVVVSDDVDGRD